MIQERDDKEELVKREWKRCKNCEYREVVKTGHNSFSFCTFWDNSLKAIKWCNYEP